MHQLYSPSSGIDYITQPRLPPVSTWPRRGSAPSRLLAASLDSSSSAWGCQAAQQLASPVSVHLPSVILAQAEGVATGLMYSSS